MNPFALIAICTLILSVGIVLARLCLLVYDIINDLTKGYGSHKTQVMCDWLLAVTVIIIITILYFTHRLFFLLWPHLFALHS